MAISMSVAVSVSLPSRTASITLARVGMVLRRSTTLWTWASAFIRVARSAFSFMASHPQTAGPRLAPTDSRATVAIGVSAAKHVVGASPARWSGFEHAAKQLDVLGEAGVEG